MYLATISGWPELGFLVAWDTEYKDQVPFPSQCELVLATHNGRDTYNNQVLLDRGFELSPQHYRNPNSEAARCSFFAGWRENVKIDDLIYEEERPFKSLPKPAYQTVPYFCGIRIGPKEFYTQYKDKMEHCCGNIHILDPVNQEEDLNFFLKIGFEPVVPFKSGRVLLARFFPKYLVKD